MRWLVTVLMLVASVRAHADDEVQQEERDPKAIAVRVIVERVDTNRVVITASAPNREALSRTVSVAIGKEVEVEVPALKKLPGQVVEEEVPQGNPWLGLAVASTTVTLGAFALYFYAGHRVGELERQSQRLADMLMNHDEIDEQGRKWSRMSYVGSGVFVFGGIATAVFVVKGVRRRS